MSRDDVLKRLMQNRGALRKFGVRRLGLFGSCARNEATLASDLDFLVELDHKTFDAYMGLKVFLEDLYGCNVDLVIEDNLKPLLRPHVLKDLVYAEGI